MSTLVKNSLVAVFLGFLVATVTAGLSPALTYAAACDSNVPTGSIHRFYMPQSSGHFYVVGGTHEYNTVKQYQNFREEGEIGVSTCFGDVSHAVYRFYNFKTGTHFYTINEAEVAHIRNNLSHALRYEGPVFYAFKERITNLRGHYVSPTVHRFYNFKSGTHFYTSNQAEATYINNTLYRTFRYEGEAFYLDVGHQP